LARGPLFSKRKVGCSKRKNTIRFDPKRVIR
jgi:hypothetical protein